MKKTMFWKSVGGYLLAVKLGGRWYYVGKTGAENLGFHKFMKEKGYVLERVQGMPLALARIWKEQGATVNALKQTLPFYKTYFEKEVKQVW